MSLVGMVVVFMRQQPPESDASAATTATSTRQESAVVTVAADEPVDPSAVELTAGSYEQNYEDKGDTHQPPV